MSEQREAIARAFGYQEGAEVTVGGSMQNDYAWDMADELGAEVAAGRMTMEQAIARAPVFELREPVPEQFADGWDSLGDAADWAASYDANEAEIQAFRNEQDEAGI